MKKVVFLITILSLLSKMIGFAREIVLAYFFGTTQISDAYQISIAIPMAFFLVLGTGFITTFIPMYNEILNIEGEKEANLFTNRLVLVITSISVIVVLLMISKIELFIKLFASGFDNKTYIIAVTFTTISVFGLFLNNLIYIFKGYLQINDNYVVPQLIGIPFNIIILLSIYYSYNMNNIYILPIGNIIALASQTIWLVFLAFKYGFRFCIPNKIIDQNIRKVLYLSIPTIVGVSINELNVIIDKTLASRVVGGISALNYANRLNITIVGIFALPIATVFYPTISKFVTLNKMDEAKQAISESVIGIIILVVPSTIGILVFSREIIEILFMRGQFDSYATTATTTALFFYSFGMIAVSLKEVLSKVFFSMQDTKTPMTNAAIGTIINIVLNVLLSYYFGIGGLALATSIASIFTMGLMCVSLRRKIGSFGMKHIFISFLKILLASLIMGGFVKISFDYLEFVLPSNLSFILTIAAGVVLYFVIIYFMKIKDVDVIVDVMKKKFSKLVA